MPEEPQPSPESPSAEAVSAPSADSVDQMTTLRERSIAALSYAGFFAIVPFYLKKDSAFCRFHGKQGMVIALIFFLAKLLLVLDFLMDLALIIQFIIFIRMGFAALSGQWKKFPFFYNLSCQLEQTLSLDDPKEEKTDDKQ